MHIRSDCQRFPEHVEKRNMSFDVRIQKPVKMREYGWKTSTVGCIIVDLLYKVPDKTPKFLSLGNSTVGLIGTAPQSTFRGI